MHSDICRAFLRQEASRQARSTDVVIYVLEPVEWLLSPIGTAPRNEQWHLKVWLSPRTMRYLEFG